MPSVHERPPARSSLLNDVLSTALVSLAGLALAAVAALALFFAGFW